VATVDKAKQKAIAECFMDIDRRAADYHLPPATVAEIRAEAQALYDQLPPELDTRYLGVDGILFDLGVQPRANDPMYTNRHSPWANGKRQVHKEVLGLAPDLSWMTIECRESRDGNVANPLRASWSYTVQFKNNPAVLFEEDLPTRDAAIAAGKAHAQGICECEIESLRAKVAQWETILQAYTTTEVQG